MFPPNNHTVLLQGTLGTRKDVRRRNTGEGGAIVTDIPGTTRDRRECYGRIGGTVFHLVDTAGVDGERIGVLNKAYTESKGEKTLDRRMIEQTLEAAKSADLVLLIFDARVGVTSDLAETARWLRKLKKGAQQERIWTDEPQHIMVLANKLEGDRWLQNEDSPVLEHLVEATRCGFGEAVPISAAHGEGMADIAVLIEELSEKKREAMGYTEEDVIHRPSTKKKNDSTELSKPDDENEKPLQLAILGRPNVGKSTLVNALLKQERVIAGSTPGLTRDAIAVEWSWNGRPVRLVDTAGIRRIVHRKSDIEDFAVQDAARAMKVADVAVLVVDAGAGNMIRTEMAIANAVMKEGRALVVAANKMDLIVGYDKETGETYTPKDFAKAVAEEIEVRFPPFRNTPVVSMSSLTGQNVEKLMPVVFEARDRWERTISTGLLNRWLSDVVEAHPPPMVSGYKAKIKYCIQTKGRPPTFLLFSNVSELPLNYMNYLRRNFQDTFSMYGMEVRFAVKFSAKENPYEPKGSRRAGSGLGGRDARKKRMITSLKKTGLPPPGRKKRKKRQ